MNTMSIQPVGDEGKERKNGVDRTKAACEEGKLNTTRSTIVLTSPSSLQDSEIARVTGAQVSRAKKRRTNERENLSEMDENIRIDTAEDSKEKQAEDIRAVARALGNYFTADKNPKNEGES